MRRTLLALCLVGTALCLVGTVFGSPAAADLIEIEITSGQTSRPVNETTSAFLNLFGDQFSLTAALFSFQRFLPGTPYSPC